MTAATSPPLAVLLPGILMPSLLRYAPLIDALGQDVRAVPKELEVYASDQPPDDYGITTELDGLDRFLDERGVDAVHLYGHSAGGSVALAYAAARPDRVLSLAVDEPASDFSDEDRAALREQLPARLADLPVPERMRVFITSLLRPGVAPPAPTAPPPGPEMGKRPQGLVAFEAALQQHELDSSALERFPGPVYFSYGALSSARWEQMATRASSRWPTSRIERYEGLHHLNTSHQAEPGRVASALRELWNEAASGR